MQLWRASNGQWYEAACPGGGVEYVAVPKEKYAEVKAALAAAEKVLGEKLDGTSGCITNATRPVWPRLAREALAQIRAAQKVNEEAE